MIPLSVRFFLWNIRLIIIINFLFGNGWILLFSFPYFIFIFFYKIWEIENFILLFFTQVWFLSYFLSYFWKFSDLSYTIINTYFYIVFRLIYYLFVYFRKCISYVTTCFNFSLLPISWWIWLYIISFIFLL